MVIVVAVAYYNWCAAMFAISYYSIQFNSIQFISHSIDPLQGQRPHGYRNSQDYNQLGPITNC
jgi:hypothetical protein